MRCSYSAGVLYALAKEYGFQRPDIAIATSGSVGSLLYYITGQYDGFKKVWTQLLSTPKFISFLRVWKIMDIDYLVDQVFKKQVPLDTQTLSNTPIQFHLPIAGHKSGNVRYISNSDSVDIFETIRAAKAIPVVYGAKICIEGEQYIDGGMNNTFERTIKKAQALGADTIIAIDTRARWKRLRLLKAAETDPSIILITNTDIPTRLMTQNKKKLQQAFELGYRDAVEHKELRKILSSL